MRKFEKVSRIKEDIKLPERATEKSAGYDFFAIEDVEIPPYKLGDKPFNVATGIKIQMLDDESLELLNRSSNPEKKNLVIPQSLGLIDADYYNNTKNEGEVFFSFYNLNTQSVSIKKGEKLGQGVFRKYLIVDNDNAKGIRQGGFGSTGK
ncbi:MAG: dUTP diphosphatase [Clostridia bacterium]|nr:dUTP diphosphatase [Clostridia bacterium]